MMQEPQGRLFDKQFMGRLERLRVIAKAIALRGPTGAVRSPRVGDGLEFADHRQYNPGDDVRFIDWPYYARMEKLLLRMFHEHSEAGVVILLDASASMAPGEETTKFDYARRVAAALAYVGTGSLHRVTLVSFSDQPAEPIRVGRSRTAVLALLEELAALQPAGGTDLLGCVRGLERRPHLGGTVLLISDLLDCGRDLSEALFRLTVLRCDAAVLHVQAQQDIRPSMRGSVELLAAENGGRLGLHVTEALLESYRCRWTEFCSRCRQTCLSRGAIYVPAETDLGFERLILTTLKRAGVLSA